MTYEKLFDLKYRQGVSTYDLIQQYPSSAEQVSKVALLEVPMETLKTVILHRDELTHLLGLKKRLLRFLERRNSNNRAIS